jgi:hypothetical protein
MVGLSWFPVAPFGNAQIGLPDLDQIARHPRTGATAIMKSEPRYNPYRFVSGCDASVTHCVA